MNHLSIIIQREYYARVRKKSFIILTFLTPILIVALIAAPMLLSTVKDEKTRVIAVADATGRYLPRLENSNNYQFVAFDGDVARLSKEHYNDFYAYLVIQGNLADNSGKAELYSNKQISFESEDFIRRQLLQLASDDKIASYEIAGLEEILRDFQPKVKLSSVVWSGESGETQKTSSEISMIIGMLTTFIIYFFIYVYGCSVMNSVFEEKTNRIVEIIVSSVKPFQLMMGKIIGIALVGLTQFFLWIILLSVLLFIASSTLHIPLNTTDLPNMAQTNVLPGDSLEMLQSITSLPFGKILLWFVLYFIGGYLLYASLFAAVGAAIDNNEDAQQFVLPITIPILFALYAGIYGANNPEGPLALWCSYIPFTSPIVMMVRLPFGVPLWELLVSFGILILTFLFSTKIAAKIYRTGILMYGKKIGYRDIWKWLTHKA